MGVLKRLPVIGKDLLEDTPVPRGCCNHRVAPSGGDTIVTVQRLYHALAASSTPHRPVYGPPQPPRSSLINGSFRDRKNAFSYTIEIPTRSPGGGKRKTAAVGSSVWWWRRSIPSASREALEPKRSASFSVVFTWRRMWAVRPAPCEG